MYIWKLCFYENIIGGLSRTQSHCSIVRGVEDHTFAGVLFKEQAYLKYRRIQYKNHVCLVNGSKPHLPLRWNVYGSSSSSFSDTLSSFALCLRRRAFLPSAFFKRQ